jgi:frataxin-like iron-binding protein CyaY
MALYNHNRQISFNEIRVVFTVEGFYVENNFVIKELGYKSKDLNGSIFFNTDSKLLNKKDKNTSYFLSNFVHGINFYKNNEHWISSKDYSSVIKTIYQLTEDKNDKNKKYIGYSNDINVLTLLHNSGLDKISVNLKQVFEDIPTIKKIKLLPAYGFGSYAPCHMHDRSTEYKFQCAKVKSLILFEWCLEKYMNQIINKYGID